MERNHPEVPTKKLLKDWVVEALRASGGSASVVDVAKHIWAAHEQEIRWAGDLLFTWQYDMRWAAHALRREGVVRRADRSPRGIWELA